MMVPQELLSFFFGMATFSGTMFNFWDFILGVEVAIHPLIHRGVVSSESSTFGDQAHTRTVHCGRCGGKKNMPFVPKHSKLKTPNHVLTN